MDPKIDKLVSPEEFLLLKQVRELVLDFLPNGVPEDEHGQKVEVTSHMLARAVADVFRLKLVDGVYAFLLTPHSWVETPKGNIIDVSPVCTAGGPVIVVAKSTFQTEHLYRKSNPGTLKQKLGLDLKEKGFVEATRQLTEHMHRIKRGLS